VAEEELTATHSDLVHEDRVPLQTFRRSFEQICTGEDPWIALGIFVSSQYGGGSPNWEHGLTGRIYSTVC
jgi:hypothetical protein